MILTLDRIAGTVEGAGITTSIEPTGDVWPYWCRDARAAGIDLQGLVLDLWDVGAIVSGKRRTEPMHCMTVTIKHADRLKLPAFPAPRKEKA